MNLPINIFELTFFVLRDASIQKIIYYTDYRDSAYFVRASTQVLPLFCLLFTSSQIKRICPFVMAASLIIALLKKSFEWKASCRAPRITVEVIEENTHAFQINKIKWINCMRLCVWERAINSYSWTSLAHNRIIIAMCSSDSTIIWQKCFFYCYFKLIETRCKCHSSEHVVFILVQATILHLFFDSNIPTLHTKNV